MIFDAVRNNKRIVQVFLALITLPFAFWGIDSYVRDTGAGTDLASVGDSKISRQQFDQAWRVQQDRMRQALGESFDAAAMNTPAARLAVLHALVDQRLLLLEAAKGRLVAGDDQLRDVISKIPTLQEDGQFSMSRYKAALAAQGMSQPQFEAQLRQDLTLQQLVAAISDTGIVSDALIDRMLRIQSEERQIAELRFLPERFLAQVNVEPAAVERYYEENRKQFETPEEAKAEFVVLSLEALMDKLAPSEAEVAAWYEAHKDRYQRAEERRASHILLLSDDKLGKEQARAKAEKILKEVQTAPGEFAELAKRYSQDPGSADKGGDLGFFGRGMMVKPFEDSVFALQENQVSGVVESDFGFHIIKLTGIKPGEQRPLAEVRTTMVEEMKRQTAARQFAEAAEAFSNLVYEQPDSLQPAAERFALRIQRSDWLRRDFSPSELASLGQLGNTKVVSALFSADSLKLRRNTEAVEVAPNVLLSARVAEYRPASVKPFVAVREEITAMLRARDAAALARQAGETQLAALQAGVESKLAWASPVTVSRLDPKDLPAAALQAIFRTDVSKLPVYVGVELQRGSYTLYQISKVGQGDAGGDQRRQDLHGEYMTIIGQEDFSGYLAGLRARYKIDINRAALESRER